MYSTDSSYCRSLFSRDTGVHRSWRYPFPPLIAGGPIQNLASHRDGSHLAFLSQGGIPAVWNLLTRRQVYSSGLDDFPGARDRGLAGGVTLSPDDALLAAQAARSDHRLGHASEETPAGLARGARHQLGPGLEPRSPEAGCGFLRRQPDDLEHYPNSAQLAEIGLDWQDAPLLPAASSELAEAGSEARPVETARLFAAALFDTAQATLAVLGIVCRVDIAVVDGTNWHARITTPFDDPQAGATYTVRFRAKADAPRQILARWIYR